MTCRRRALWLGLCCLWLAWPTQAQAQEESLALYYFHRPPFYFREGQAGPGCQGLVLERACRVLRAAGVPFTLVELPVKRVLKEIKWGHYGCGVGWFRLAARQDYADFSLPLYQSQPLALVVNHLRAGGLPARPSLGQVLTSGLTRGAVAGYAYGQEVDDLLARLRPPTVTITGTSENMLRMVASGRCDYWLIDAEEAGWLLAHHPGPARALELRPLAEVPPGQTRHLMCSKRVPPEVLQRIDQAIASLYGRLPEVSARPEPIPGGAGPRRP